MSKKEEKEKPAKEDKAKAAAGKDELEAPSPKKKKLVLFAGIGAVLLISLGVGGFFVYKTFLAKPTTLSAKAEGGAAADGKETSVDAKTDAKADGKADGRADAKTDAKAEGGKKDAQAAKADAKDGAKKDDTSAKDGAKKDEQPASAAAKDGAKKDDAAAAAPSADGAKKEGETTADGDKKDEKKPGAFGDTYEIPRMDLNLGNALENRYLRVALSMEYAGGKDQAEEIKKREPQVRDIIISSVSSKTRMDLLSDRGKAKLRRELLNRFNEVFERPVANVYFTEFLVE